MCAARVDSHPTSFIQEPIPVRDFHWLMFAYFSPETLLPATSIIATVAGIVLMLGRGSLRLLAGATRRGLRGPTRIAGTSRPHRLARDEAHARGEAR